MLVYKPTNKYPKRVGSVEFGLLTSDEIKRMSVVHVHDTTIYNKGMPNPHGINDHRMGTVDRRLLCGTCGKDVQACQGHIGHIELAFPMYHVGFIDVLLKTLRCVCFICSRIVMSDEEIAGTPNALIGKARFQWNYQLLKNRKRCCHCNTIRPQYVRTAMSIRTEWADTTWTTEEEKNYMTNTFTQKDALSIMTHMTDSDVLQLGLNPDTCHPKNLILTTLLVPPPVARPAIMASEGSRSRGQDDLTLKLQDINKRSNELHAAIEKETWKTLHITKDSTDVLEKISRLQFEVSTYFNNNIRGQKQSTQRSGVPTKSITDRLKGKDGRIRGNLMGKRVDFSARSVITPDPLMDIDQVGVPYKIAMLLTIPERVTSTNIEDLTRRAVIGPDNINGAETVITASGTTIQLAHCDDRDKLRLQYGWVVERFLKDDDIVVFNRQPSLHRMGMMGHRVKLMPGLTFRLNLCCANPYNADFDGDEMNLHVVQSHAANSDVAALMMVNSQIISPQANRPVMGIVQDTLLGAYLMSQCHVKLNRAQVCSVIAKLRHTQITQLPVPALLRPEELWTGKQVLSLIFPVCFNYGNVKADVSCTGVFFKNGNLLCGELSKKTLGSTSSGCVDTMYREFGPHITGQWMSEIQRLVNNWLLGRGFSVGIGDCVIGESGETRVQRRIQIATSYAEELVEEYQGLSYERSTVLEAAIKKFLSKTLTQTGGIVEEELNADNAIRSMVNAGSKGNPINLSQICGCVGQQSIDGQRVVSAGETRTLSCFPFNDVSLAGHGFVTNSYALGLHPHEYFFHAMGGREGLVDTAVKTATTGYIQRRQIKSMEDHKVHYDDTVRNGEDCIVDFIYGGDGFDACRIERITLNLLLEPDESILKRMTAWEATTALRAKRLICECKINALNHEMDARIVLPFNPKRLKKLLEDQVQNGEHEDEIGMSKYVKTLVESIENVAIQASLLDNFCTAELMRMKATKTGLSLLDTKIKKCISSAQVQYGEMVGSIAAQSVGEPCTQMSIRGSEKIVVKKGDEFTVQSIRDVVDSICDCDQPTVKQAFEIIGVTQIGIAKTARVIGVSRHCANGTMLSVTTKSGRTVVATASHSFVTRDLYGFVVPIKGYDLRRGILLPFLDHRMRNSMLQLPRTHDTSTLGDFFCGCLRDLYHIFCFYDKPHVEQASRPDYQVQWDEIVSIVDLGFSYETVYDLTVDQELQTFMLANGLFVHNTLNTFHFAGVSSKNVTHGIPRLKELLDQTKQIRTPCNTIRFKKPMSQSKRFCEYFANTIPLTRLGDIVTECDLIFDPDIHKSCICSDQYMVDLDRALGQDCQSDCSQYVCRILLNQDIMRTRHVTPPVVRTILLKRLRNKAHVLSSETNSSEWVLRVRFHNVNEMIHPIEQSWGHRENLLCHRIISVLLETVAICGHMKIQNAFCREMSYDGDMQFVVDTSGCALIDLSIVNGVDWYNTTSNDVSEVLLILGVEAAAMTLYHELMTTIMFDGTYVDPRHIGMIVNTMTFRGYIMPLSRHGINRISTGPLIRCSFEETTDILCDAACFAENDTGKGVSQNIMTGKLASIGSGCMDIKMSANCMHTNEVTRAARMSVMKSKIRAKLETRNSYQRVDFALSKTQQCQSKVMEPPFRTSDDPGRSFDLNIDQMFAQRGCDKPFDDQISARGQVIFDQPIILPKVYKPSSPKI